MIWMLGVATYSMRHECTYVQYMNVQGCLTSVGNDAVKCAVNCVSETNQGTCRFALFCFVLFCFGRCHGWRSSKIIYEEWRNVNPEQGTRGMIVSRSVCHLRHIYPLLATPENKSIHHKQESPPQKRFLS